MAHSSSPRRPPGSLSARWDELSARLAESEKVQAAGVDLVATPVERQTWQAEEEKQKAALFSQHRRSHYDEYKKMKQWRIRHDGSLSDEEEEADASSSADNS